MVTTGERTDTKGTARWRQRRRELATELAMPQGGVVHRAQLRAEGVTRGDVRAEARSGRWSPLGRHTILLGDRRLLCGTDTDPDASTPRAWTARAWWAVWESGSGAALDGVSALRAAGLEGYSEEVVHVTIPCGADSVALPGVRRHWQQRVERYPGGGVPRTRVESAVIRAAQWAVSDRQAALVLAMAVQQRLVPPNRVWQEWQKVQRSPRRELIGGVIRDVSDGAQALSELDFAAMCRARGLPAPTRQVVRTGAKGRVYLDVLWQEAGLAVEIEGAHHTQGVNAVDDALRQNELTIGADVMLRIPVLGLRLEPDRFMGQVQRAYQSAIRQRR